MNERGDRQMDVMLKVLIQQNKYRTKEVNNHFEVEKLNEVQTLDYQGYKLPKVGGTVEDNVFQILGYVFDESLYSQDGVRKKETMLPYDWTRPDTIRLSQEELKRLAI
jgi:hypothetical protein